MINCPDCQEPLIEIRGAEDNIEYRCQFGCSLIVPYPDVFQKVADTISGVQLESIINWLIDIGYDVQYLGDGTYKKLYRKPRP